MDLSTLPVCLLSLIMLMYISMPPLPLYVLKTLHGSQLTNLGWIAIVGILTKIHVPTALCVGQLMILGNLEYRKAVYQIAIPHK